MADSGNDADDDNDDGLMMVLRLVAIDESPLLAGGVDGATRHHVLTAACSRQGVGTNGYLRLIFRLE